MRFNSPQKNLASHAHFLYPHKLSVKRFSTQRKNKTGIRVNTENKGAKKTAGVLHTGGHYNVAC